MLSFGDAACSGGARLQRKTEHRCEIGAEALGFGVICREMQLQGGEHSPKNECGGRGGQEGGSLIDAGMAAASAEGKRGNDGEICGRTRDPFVSEAEKRC